MAKGGKTIIESTSDSFMKLARYVGNHWRAAFGTLILLSAAAVISLTIYFLYTKILATQMSQEEIIKSLNQINPTPEAMNEALKDVTNQDVLINKILLDKIQPIGGDRSYLIRFHNNLRDINGTHFMFMSTTNEVNGPGISEGMSDFQKIPTSYIPSWWIDSLLQGACVAEKIDDLKEDTSPAKMFRNAMLSMGIKYVRVCPIVDMEKGTLLGVVGTSWVTRIPEIDDCMKVERAMLAQNGALSAILSVNSKKTK